MTENSTDGDREVPAPAGCYESEDLDRFMDILRSLVDELREEGSPLVAADQIELTRVRAAAAIFRFADGGLRDTERLGEKVRDHLTASQGVPNRFYLHQRRLKPD